jgi:hypothetical protein
MDFHEFCKTWSPFDEYRVKVKLSTIAGGTPKHGDLLKGWIDATNKELSAEERAKLVDATKAELPDISEAKEAKSWVGFKSDGDGLYIEGRQVKAMLKESANIIKKIAPTRKDKKSPNGVGITAFKSKVADHVFVVETKIHLTKGGEPVKEKDEHEERPIHVMTAQGPRNSIKRTDLVHDAEIEFTVRRLNDAAVPEKALYAVLAYGQHIGLGADRSQGMGTFRVTSVEKSAESCLARE